MAKINFGEVEGINMVINSNLGESIESLKIVSLDMMDKCSDIIEKAILSVINKDIELAREVLKLDDSIDKLRVQIVEKSIELIALKQPMAKDLRFIYALGHIALDLERIGDYSTNIAMEAIKIGEEDPVAALTDIPKMKNICLKMLEDTKTALECNDSNIAYKAAKEDDIVDQLYNDVHADVLSAMHIKEENINGGVKLLLIGRYLERIGDHITNVCENIIYAVTGNMVEIG